jgi:low affinity Fe/Cu permease
MNQNKTINHKLNDTNPFNESRFLFLGFLLLIILILVCLIFLYMKKLQMQELLNNLTTLQDQLYFTTELYTNVVNQKSLEISELKEFSHKLSTVSQTQTLYVNTTLVVTSLLIIFFLQL